MQCTAYGETTLPLLKQIHVHRRGESRCDYVMKHFKDVSFGASLNSNHWGNFWYWVQWQESVSF